MLWLKLLVTVKDFKIKGITTTKSLVGVDLSNIECLIFHSSTDADLDVIFSLSKLKGSVKKIIYISDDLNPVLYQIFRGLDADIYDNSDYLSEDSTVHFLIDDYKNTGLEVKTTSSDLSVLSKGINAISSSVDDVKSFVSNKLWVKSLQNAVENVEKALMLGSEVEVKSVESWGEAAKYVGVIKESQDSTMREIETLRKMVEDFEVSFREQEKTAKPDSAFIYSTYNVQPSVSKVMYIRGYGHCRFLNSFILSYQAYLKYTLQKSSKVLFVFPKSKLVMARYKSVPRLARDSINFMDIVAHDTFITYEPKKIILDAFFNQSNVHLFIVVDMMFNDQLLEGAKVEHFSALSGCTDIAKFGVSHSRSFLSIAGVEGSMVIPFIREIAGSQNEATKKSLYFKKCNEIYSKVDKILFGDDV